MSDLGLVVTIYDILDIQGGSIYASEGAAHYTVKFRLVVFRPFIGELLVGRLTKCDKCALLIPARQSLILQNYCTPGTGIIIACSRQAG